MPLQYRPLAWGISMGWGDSNQRALSESLELQDMQVSSLQGVGVYRSQLPAVAATVYGSLCMA